MQNIIIGKFKILYNCIIRKWKKNFRILFRLVEFYASKCILL